MKLEDEVTHDVTNPNASAPYLSNVTDDITNPTGSVAVGHIQMQVERPGH